MVRPQRNRIIPDEVGATELRESLESAMWGVSAAMEDLRGLERFQDYFDTMYDLYDEMLTDLEELDVQAASEYADQMEELSKEYRRGL